MSGLLDSLKDKKVALLFSGGMESTTLLAECLDSNLDVVPICFPDGTPFFEQKEQIAILSVLHHYDRVSALVRANIFNTDDVMYADGKSSYVPGWKMIMQISAMALCEKLGVHTLLFGYESSNTTYADESERNIQDTATLYNRIYQSDIKVECPYRTLTKTDVLRRGVELGVPYEKTFSCSEYHLPGIMHCGRCKLCLKRLVAFDELNSEFNIKSEQVVDRALYLQYPPDSEMADRQNRAPGMLRHHHY